MTDISQATSSSISKVITIPANRLRISGTELTVTGYPYRFKVHAKKDGKVFYRCGECRNLKVKFSPRPPVGSLMLYIEKNVVVGSVTNPGGYRHVCDDPVFCSLPNDLKATAQSEQCRAGREIVSRSRYKFHKYCLLVDKQPGFFRKIGCANDLRVYCCNACFVNREYKLSLNDCLIFDIHQATLFGNVGSLPNLIHACKGNIAASDCPNLHSILLEEKETEDDYCDDISVESSFGEMLDPTDQNFLSDDEMDFEDAVSEITRIPSSTPLPDEDVVTVSTESANKCVCCHKEHSGCQSKETPATLDSVVAELKLLKDMVREVYESNQLLLNYVELKRKGFLQP